MMHHVSSLAAASLETASERVAEETVEEDDEEPLDGPTAPLPLVEGGPGGTATSCRRCSEVAIEIRAATTRRKCRGGAGRVDGGEGKRGNEYGGPGGYKGKVQTDIDFRLRPRA